MASGSNFMCILQRLQRIRKKLRHFLGRFYIILAALIAHPVLIRQLLLCLQAQKNVMGALIPGIRIVYVIRRHQLDFQLPAHAQKLLVHRLLLRNPMILKLQKIIPFPENPFISQCSAPRLFIHSTYQIPLHFSCKAGAQRNNSFMVFLQYLHIHPRFIIKTFYKAF